MKKLMFVMFTMVAMMTACETKETTPAPTTTEDSTTVVDTVNVDTTVVDSTVAE
jgi:hypothetical protein